MDGCERIDVVERERVLVLETRLHGTSPRRIRAKMLLSS